MQNKKMEKEINVPSAGEESQGDHHFPPIDGHTVKPNPTQLISHFRINNVYLCVNF